MGVLSCYRNGCDNIMCNTYVNEVGYICYECQAEFKNYLIVEGRKINSEFDMKSELKLFMNTCQGRFLTKESSFDTDEFFRQYTR